MSLLIDDRVTLQGAPGSPYTRKMLALLRYRHIPYRFMHPGSSEKRGWSQPKVALLPTFYFPDDQGQPQPVTDSTPIIRRLEREFSSREAIPPNPVLAMIDRLIEDYADEWLTKSMFHYRWVYEDDIQRSAITLPHWRHPAQSDAVLDEQGKRFAERQISRLGVVGSNKTTGPVIEASYRRFIDLLSTHLKQNRFLLGGRPGSADFAIFGQLTCLAQFDPTPMKHAFEIAGGRIYAWVSVMEDLSGLEPKGNDWIDPTNVPASVSALLTEMGRTYVPVMLANEKAVLSGASTVEAIVDQLPWRQRPFPYQAKCVRWLRDAFDALTPANREALNEIIADTGLPALFTAPH